MSTLILIVATVVLLIFINALYVISEFGTVAARKTRVSQMAATGNPLAKIILPIMEDGKMLDNYVAACQVGITVSSLALGAFGQGVIARQLAGPLAGFVAFVEPLLLQLGFAPQNVTTTAAHSLAATLVLIILTILQVVLGELFPKSVAIQYPEKVALATAVPMRWSMLLLRPLIWFFNGSGNLVLRLLGYDQRNGMSHIHSPEEIEILVTESHEGGLLDEEERMMLRNTFRMRELTARQVMVHRTRISAAPADSSVLELINMVIEAGITRIPLYQGNVDSVIGFVHIKDLFRLHVEGRENLAEILREVVYVPESLPVADVWDTLHSQRQYMAIVFDEYGGTAGLITFEDLIEEIFGELQDEFDNEIPLISRDKEGRVYLRGDLLVTDVNEYLDLQLPEDAADTLSGLVLSELGHPPEVGDEIMIGGTVIRVETMVDLGVSEVSLQEGSPEEVSQVGQVGEWEVASHE
jgi:putative hemolysin